MRSVWTQPGESLSLAGCLFQGNGSLSQVLPTGGENHRVLLAVGSARRRLTTWTLESHLVGSAPSSTAQRLRAPGTLLGASVLPSIRYMAVRPGQCHHLQLART